MNTQSVGYKAKGFGARKLAFLFLVIVLLLPACTGQPQPAKVEEITFQSGKFTLVGELRTPAGNGPFPVVLFVHGADVADRTWFGYFLPVMERMLRAGYAVFSWDKPGYGESTGQLGDTRVYHQLAQIVLDAIEVMQARSDIDPQRIGLWGTSQGGWVMPLVLSQSEEVAFMICVACGGVSGLDQFAYLVSSQAVFCEDVPEENGDQLTALLTELDAARTFDTYSGYVHYREVLDDLVGISPNSREVSNLMARHGVVVIPEQAWLENDPEIDSRWNPVEVLEQVQIPVLAIFGDRDVNVDPIQGAYAWKAALEQAGNRNFRVELLPGVTHGMTVSDSTCIVEQEKALVRVLQEQGYGPMEESFALFQQEPGQHTPFRVWPYAPEYLDLIEEWLRDLRR